MRRKSRAIRRGLTLLLTAGLVLAGAQGAGAATVHTAGDADTFWTLSKTYGIPLDKLMAANPNIDPLNIYKGLKLVIPDADSSPVIHTAAEGDTFWLVIPNAGSGGTPDGTESMPATAEGETATSGSGSTAASVFAAGQAGERPQTYKSAIQVKATAYTASAEENGIWGPVDYFGNPLSLGTVAVDPDVIPLGSKLYIAGYDYAGLPTGGMYAVATDTGGAIKGNRIDIFVPDSRAEALKFGIQSVTVYVL